MTGNRIDATFSRLAGEGRKGFIAYIMAGDPEPAMTVNLVMELGRSGADIVELGVPFTDPLADGVVNQRASERALRHGITLGAVFEIVAAIRSGSDIPIVLFSYMNPLFAYGFRRFAGDAARAGIDGVLCLDLPPEEAGEYEEKLSSRGIHSIFLAAPTTPMRRVALISRHASGFIYYVSRTGVTGEREHLESDVENRVRLIRSVARLPVAVGFGISTPAQVRAVAGVADAVVVGSSLVKEIEARGGKSDILRRVGERARYLSAPLKR